MINAEPPSTVHRHRPPFTIYRLPSTIRLIGLALAVVLLLALLTFALPVRTWRTGELPAPPLPVVRSGPPVTLSSRVWVDTDAACGQGRRTDPDDCHALLRLGLSPEIEIAGISTVFGNAPLAATDSVTRELVRVLERGGRPAPPVFRGSAQPIDEGSTIPAPAHEALRRALAGGPLTLVSLGPVTNTAVALQGRPELRARVVRHVAVMGRRPGHLFHPAEGAGGGMLLGHGPVFRDFNFDQDRAAATRIVRMGLPTTLVPYEAAREVSLTAAELDRMAAAGGASEWVAERSRSWLEYWRKDIGRDGFYPFDLLAAAYVIEQRLFDCARADAWVGEDDELWELFDSRDALLVGPVGSAPSDAASHGPVVYCPGVAPELHGWLIRTVAGSR